AGLERDVESGRAAPGLAGERAHRRLLVRRQLEDDLVVDLEDEPAGVAALLERVVETDEGDLEDVGGQPLDAGVHRLALAGLADAVVRRRQLRDLAATADQRLGVAPVAGL